MDDRHRVAGNGGTGQNPAYSPTRPHTRTDPGALGQATGVRHATPVKSGPTTLGGRGSGGAAEPSPLLHDARARQPDPALSRPRTAGPWVAAPGTPLPRTADR